MMKQVFLYSDDPIAAKGLEAVLAETGRFRLTDVFCRVPDLVARLAVDVPDIVLLDLTNEMTSTALSNIKKATNSRLVLWANSISTELAFEAMGLGVCGILRRTLSIELQVKCLQKVTEGELWFEKILTDRFIPVKTVVPSHGQGYTSLADLQPLIWKIVRCELWMPNQAEDAFQEVLKRVIRRFESQDALVWRVCRDVVGKMNRTTERLLRQILAELPEADAELLRQDMRQADNEVLCQQFGVTREYLRMLRHRVFERLREELRKLHTGQPED